MRKKLHSSKGMTLTELLVALAIVALIGMSLTVGVSGAAKIYRDSTQLFEAETLCGTILTYLEDEFRFGRNIRNETVGTETKVIFDSQVFGSDAEVIVEDGKVKIQNKSSDLGSASAKFDLLGDKAYTNGLQVLEKECIYTEAANPGEKDKVTITIAVGPAGTDDSDDAYVSHTVTVSPIDD